MAQLRGPRRRASIVLPWWLVCVASTHALDNGVGLSPAAGWSSWNVFGGHVTADAVMGMADVLVDKGLDKLGYVYVGIDCGWDLHTRAVNGDLQPDPAKFPHGIKRVADYVKSLGTGLLKLGIYTEHFTGDCCGGPGMKGFEDQDARFFSDNGIEYLKVDSCAGHNLNASAMYADYAAIRDALNRTGTPIYLNICPTMPIKDIHPAIHPSCNAWGNDIYSSYGFEAAGLDVRAVANSALVEFCNNANNWEIVMGLVDAQQVLSNDSWSAPGSWIDADMLTVGCNDNRIPGTPCDQGTPLTVPEQYTQMSLWSLFASNLMLGSDLRNISETTLQIIGNPEVLAVNRDPLGAHGRLVYDHTGNPPPTPPAPPAPPLRCAAGALAPDGGFLRVANSTLADAIMLCRKSQRCGGFTTRTPNATTCDTAGAQIHEIYFKSELGVHNTDPKWHSWTKTGWTPPPPPPRIQVFAKPMAGGKVAVALLNRGPAVADATVSWAMLGMGGPTPWKRAQVRDLWRHKELGVYSKGFTYTELPSHASALLVVTACSGPGAACSGHA